MKAKSVALVLTRIPALEIFSRDLQLDLCHR